MEYLKKLESENKINLSQASFLLPRADIAPQLLEKELEKLGAKVNNVEAYRIEPVKLEAEMLELLLNDELDLLTFTSSSTVENFISGVEKLIENQNQILEFETAEKISDQQLWRQLKEIPIACIGPVTADKAGDYGLNVKISAAEYTLEGLFTAILKYYS